MGPNMSIKLNDTQLVLSAASQRDDHCLVRPAGPKRAQAQRAPSLANEGARRKALRDAHRWLDELLVDPTQTIELLAIREGKSERSIRMTLSLAFMSPALAPPRSIGKREASASASPSRGPGNGILRAETGGLFQAQNAGERSEFGSQTATRLTNRPELRGFLPTRKPRRFAGTVWWGMQGSN